MTEAEARLRLDERLPGAWLLEMLEHAEWRAQIRAAHDAGASWPSIAREVGITLARLRSFAAGADVRTDDDRRAIAAWAASRGDPPPVHPESVAVSVLAMWFPASHVGEARRELAAAIRAVYPAHRVRLSPRIAEALETP